MLHPSAPLGAPHPSPASSQAPKLGRRKPVLQTISSIPFNSSIHLFVGILLFLSPRLATAVILIPNGYSNSNRSRAETHRYDQLIPSGLRTSSSNLTREAVELRGELRSGRSEVLEELGRLGKEQKDMVAGQADIIDRQEALERTVLARTVAGHGG